MWFLSCVIEFMGLKSHVMQIHAEISLERTNILFKCPLGLQNSQKFRFKLIVSGILQGHELTCRIYGIEKVQVCNWWSTYRFNFKQWTDNPIEINFV